MTLVIGLLYPAVRGADSSRLLKRASDSERTWGGYQRSLRAEIPMVLNVLRMWHAANIGYASQNTQQWLLDIIGDLRVRFV